MSKSILVLSLLISGCVMVNGHIRPQWDPGWAKVICTQTTNAATEIEFKIYDDHGRTLPGASILVVDSLRSQRNLLSGYDGAVAFTSEAGKFEATIEIEGFRSRYISIKKPREHSCTVEVVLVPKVSETIAAADLPLPLGLKL